MKLFLPGTKYNQQKSTTLCKLEIMYPKGMKYIILNPKAAKQISAGEISYISSPRGKSMKNNPFSFYAKASVY
jgi:hypothetical protein